MPRGYAKVDRQPISRIGLVESRSEAFVEIRLDAFDGANDGDMGNLREGKGSRDGRCSCFYVIASSTPPSASILIDCIFNQYIWKMPIAHTVSTEKYHTKQPAVRISKIIATAFQSCLRNIERSSMWNKRSGAALAEYVRQDKPIPLMYLIATMYGY